MSTGLGMAGLLVQGVSQYQAGQTRGMLNDVNAGIAQKQSESEIESGNYNANLIKLRGQQMQGQQVNAIGANNLQQTGTNTNVIADTARANEADRLTTLNNAMRRAWGFQVQGASDTFQGDLARRSGNFGLAGSIIGAGAKYETDSEARGLRLPSETYADT